MQSQNEGALASPTLVHLPTVDRPELLPSGVDQQLKVGVEGIVQGIPAIARSVRPGRPGVIVPAADAATDVVADTALVGKPTTDTQTSRGIGVELGASVPLGNPDGVGHQTVQVVPEGDAQLQHTATRERRFREVRVGVGQQDVTTQQTVERQRQPNRPIVPGVDVHQVGLLRLLLRTHVDRAEILQEEGAVRLRMRLVVLFQVHGVALEHLHTRGQAGADALTRCRLLTDDLVQVAIFLAFRDLPLPHEEGVGRAGPDDGHGGGGVADLIALVIRTGALELDEGIGRPVLHHVAIRRGCHERGPAQTGTGVNPTVRIPDTTDARRQPGGGEPVRIGDEQRIQSIVLTGIEQFAVLLRVLGDQRLGNVHGGEGAPVAAVGQETLAHHPQGADVAGLDQHDGAARQCATGLHDTDRTGLIRGHLGALVEVDGNVVLGADEVAGRLRARPVHPGGLTRFDAGRGGRRAGLGEGRGGQGEHDGQQDHQLAGKPPQGVREVHRKLLCGVLFFKSRPPVHTRACINCLARPVWGPRDSLSASRKWVAV